MAWRWFLLGVGVIVLWTIGISHASANTFTCQGVYTSTATLSAGQNAKAMCQDWRNANGDGGCANAVQYGLQCAGTVWKYQAYISLGGGQYDYYTFEWAADALCPSGTVDDGSGTCVEVNQCDATLGEVLLVETTWSFPDGVPVQPEGGVTCRNGCQYQSNGYAVYNHGEGIQWRYIGDGSQCTPDSTGIQIIPMEEAAQDPQCSYDRFGNTTCADWSSGSSNCGYFNGERICMDNLADGTCTTTPNGAIVCVGGEGTPPGTPPNQWDGTTPEPAGGLVEGDTTGSTPEKWGVLFSPTGSADGTSQDATGGTGIPSSGVTIDETGTMTEEQAASGVDPGDDGGFGDFLGGIGSESGPETLTAPDFGLSGGGTCSPLAGVTIFGVSTGPLDWCPAIDTIRVILEWFIWVVTAIFLWRAWQRALTT